MTVYCAHRELRWRHASNEPCPGLLIVDPDTEHNQGWIADCDTCGLQLGITPTQKREWLEAHRAEADTREQTTGTAAEARAEEQGEQEQLAPTAPTALLEQNSRARLRRLRRKGPGGPA